MKTFREVLIDIEKMAGLELQSIRPGAEITIEKLDWSADRILLKTARGVMKSRPFIEMEGLWKALCLKSAIHVDSELGGSGSSRNQPETILGNLPYIEWFLHARKKHLALMDTSTHAFGQLKKMDSIVAEKLKQSIQSAAKVVGVGVGGVAQVVVVSGDIATHAAAMEEVSGVKGHALRLGIYEFSLPSCRFLLLSSHSVIGDISSGTYLVIKGKPPQQEGKLVDILGHKYICHSSNGLCLLYDTNH